MRLGYALRWFFDSPVSMSLRAKVVLLALSTLVLPLVGWSLARQFESSLRESQAQVQLASAQMLARAVAMQADALPALGPAVFVQQARWPLQLDAYDGDWKSQGLLTQTLAPDLRVALAEFEGQLQLFARIEDATRVRADANWSQAGAADQLILVIEDARGTHRMRLASAAPGVLGVKALDSTPEGAPRIVGEWQEDARGYQLELRFAAADLPTRLGFEVLDFHDPAEAPRQFGTHPDQPDGRWLVQHRPQALQALLDNLVPDGVQASLTQTDGWVLAQAGRRVDAQPSQAPGFWRSVWYRLLMMEVPEAPPVSEASRLESPELWQALSDRPAVAWYSVAQGGRMLLATAVPIRIQAQVRAALLLERSSESLLLGRQALAGLMLTSLLALLVVGLGLFAFAGRLSARIRNLSRAAERAITRAGRSGPLAFQASNVRDELGDLSRSFARLLEEIDAYSEYLRGLAGTLSHELHTPIAVVRSSLENLDAEALGSTSRTYVERARAGVDRLGAIVRAMSEASRVERAIAAAEVEDFDLRALMVDCAEGYRALLAPRSLQTMLPPHAVRLRGSPDLIVQALDKLIDNARSFCPPEGWVLIALAQTQRGIEISVANAGPSLPLGMQDRLFDSLVSLRAAGQRGDGAPHLGFGLHVVRLVAQRHGGFAGAANLPSGEGVEFRMVMRGMERDARDA